MRASFVLTTVAFSLSFTSAAWSQEVERAMKAFDVQFLFGDREVKGVLPPPPRLHSFPGNYPEGDCGEPGSPRDDRPSISASTVVEMIQRFIDPDSWHSSRNSIEIHGQSIVVLQTPAVLDQVGAFLGLLEARASRLLSLDLALVPTESIEKAAPGCLRPGASPWLEASTFDAAVLADPPRSAWMAALAGEGVAVRLQPRSVSMFLERYEVNQTGALPVIAPVPQASFEGLHAVLRAFPLPQEGWLRVDLKLGRSGLRGKPDRKKALQGDVDLPVVAQEQVAASVLAPAGKVVLLGSFSPGESDVKAGGAEQGPSFAAILRVRRLGADPAPQVQGLPQVLEVDSLLAQTPDFSLPLQGSAEVRFGQAPSTEEAPSVAGTELELLLKTLAEEIASKDVDRLFVAGGAAFLSEPAAEARRVETRLQGLARERLRLVTVNLWQGAAGSAEIAGEKTAAALLDPAWLERLASRPGVRARWCALRGTRSSLASVLSRNYIAGLEMISGGTAERNAVVAQPVVASTGAGLLLNAECDLVPGSNWAQFHLRGELARPPAFGRQARARTSLEVEPTREGEKSPVQPSGEWLTIDLPDEDQDRWEHLVTAPLGRPVLLNALPDPARPGQVRALVAVVHEFEAR